MTPAEISTSDNKRENAVEGLYLTFLLGKEIYALHIMHVKEIIEYNDVTQVPMLPDFVSGIANLRGNVLPIIDLFYFFYKMRKPPNSKNCIVVIETESHLGERFEVGIIVDAVSEVAGISAANIEDAPTLGASLKNEYITGLGKYNNRFVIILKLNDILTKDQLSTAIDGKRGN